MLEAFDSLDIVSTPRRPRRRCQVDADATRVLGETIEDERVEHDGRRMV
jgi:hypothetical protein